MNEAKLYECHAHLMMDGRDFSGARQRHTPVPDLAAITAELDAMAASGVAFCRDGGDALGVSAAARVLAAERGIEYLSPLFAISREGRYGAIVGRTWRNLREYRTLVAEAAQGGCDFIKLMFSGILTFREDTPLSCPGLPPEEIRETVHIAHEEGFAVMAHVNGAESILAALEAGTDSIEHGYFMDGDCVCALAESGSVWVPTLAAVSAFLGRPGFSQQTVETVLDRQREILRTASERGVLIAAGSDAGAVGVPHGTGTRAEYRLLAECGVSGELLERANRRIFARFRRGGREADV